MPDAPLSSRRRFLRALGAGALAPLAVAPAGAQVASPSPELTPVGRAPLAGGGPPARPLLKPPRLRRGSVIGLVCPASHLDGRDALNDARRDLDRLGFRTKVGRYALARYGYLGGTDRERADDLMAMFLDPDVDAVLALRGGWGCARILPLLDYDAIRAHPKPLIGYSDITALLLAVYEKSGIVTFHGPVGRSTWSDPTADAFLRVLVEGERLVLDPARELGPDGERVSRGRRMAPRPIRAGWAEGPLVGGNLSVVSALVGTPYLPSFAGHVVFFEEVRESLYRVDRMLTQLKLAGAFEEVAALVFGQCSACTDDEPGMDLAWLLRDHLSPAGRAAVWAGAPIGHVSPVYTLPIGLRTATDAALGTLTTMEAAVA